MSEPAKTNDWNCGGWEEVEREKLQRMASLPLEEKFRWLEDARELARSIRAWRRSQGLPTITQNDEIEW